jgi:hypothetical protein
MTALPSWPEARLSAIDLDLVVEEAAGNVRSASPPSVKIATELGACAHLDGNPTELHQLVTSLLLRARDLVSKRGGTIVAWTCAVSLSAAEIALLLPDARLSAGDYVVLEVRVAAPDTRLRERMRGMSIPAIVARDHGGAITFESAPGAGVTVRVALPGRRR